MAKNIVGVDIGNNTIRAAEVADAQSARPILVRYHEVPLPEGAVRNGEVVETNTVATALRQLWAEGGFQSKEVVIGIGSQKVVARDVTVAKQSIDRIREALPFQVQELIPVPVADAILDFYPISEHEGETGPMVNGLLIAAVKDAVVANLAAVRKAGLFPLDVDLIPFALQRTLAAGQTGTVAIVEIGTSTTNVVLSTAGIPQFVRIIPSGGDDLTNVLVARLDLTTEDAVALKYSIGLATGTVPEGQREAVEVIYDFCRDLLTSIRNTLSYFINTHEGMQVEKILLAGGGTLLPGFAGALREVTGTNVEYAEPFSAIEVRKDVQNVGEPMTRARIAVALGLAVGRAA